MRTTTKQRPLLMRAAATLLLGLLMLFAPQRAWAWSGGQGTEADPYQIANYSDLQQLAANVNSGTTYDNVYFKQTANIDMTGKTMSPIGDNSSDGSAENASHRFGGHYDGGGYAISHLTITGSTKYTALFGYVCGNRDKGSIQATSLKNIVLTDCNIDGSNVSGSYAAGICAFPHTYTTVDNCRVSGTIKGEYAAGGITGYFSSGNLNTCFADVTVTASTNNSSDQDGAYQYCRAGKIVGDVPYFQGSDLMTGNYYHADGATDGTGATMTAIGRRSRSNIADADRATPVYTDSGTSGLTVSGGTPVVSLNGTNYYTQGTTYTIYDAAGWNFFCDCLNDNGTYNRFSGKTVRLGADITVSRMAGSSGHDFCGTFDGQEHTLTFNYGTAGSYKNDEYAAPFHYVSNVGSTAAAFRNLHVAGHIYTSAKYAAGLIAQHWGTVNVENCRVSTVIHSSVSDDGTHGGIEAVNIGVLNITGTVFDGKLLTTGTTATNNCGGFVGWHNGGTTNISNSLYAPAAIAVGETEVGPGTAGQNPSATFGRNAVNSIANSYYTRTLGTAQGKQARSITASGNATLAHAGVATEYSVSGITAYKSGGTFTSGILYNNVLYAGSGDAVSLTSTNTAPDGYQLAITYNDGTANHAVSPDGNGKYTITMPDANVTASANIIVIPWDGDGSEGKPYLIKYVSQLDLLAHRVNGTHGETYQADGYSGTYFQLDKDIAYSYPANNTWDSKEPYESNYEAIGGGYNDNYRYFRGHFDGNNKTISGIRIYKGGSSFADKYQGIFGLTNGADIHDLTLADARITGHNNTGGIVGYNDGGTVSGCHVAADVAVCAVQANVDYHGAVQVSVDYHGGIAGYNNNGTIEQCTSAVTLTTADASFSRSYGGIAGCNDGGTLSDNLAIGATVPATTNNTYGAIVGRNGYTGGTLLRNYYTACEVANTPNATGVGRNNADVTANNGAVSIHTLTLADGVSTTTAATVTHAGTGYYAQGTAIALSYSGTIDDGYQLAVTYNDGTADHAVGADGNGNYTITMPAANVNVSADINPITYTVLFDGNGATDGTMSNQSFTYDVAQNLTANAFSRAFAVTYSYNGATGGNNDASATATATFNGWATSADGTVAYTNQQSVSKLTATKDATVSLYANWTDGSVTLPTPTKTGYTFGGWYSDDGLTASVGAAGASYTPSAGITLYAKWTPITYYMTYNLNGGSLTTEKNSFTVESENITLDEPTRTGYAFCGWYTNEELTGDAVTTIAQGSTGNMELWARWTPFYTITYHLDGGTLTTDKNSYTIESENITLDEPTRTGYAFGGWYKNEELTGDAVTTIAQGSTGNMELWARWTPFYTITYHLDGGTLTTDYDGYTVESPAITLDKPTRSGYAFGGWYTNEELTGDAVTTIAHGSTGHREYWAKWIVDWAATSSGEDADHAYMIYNKDQLDLLAHRVNGTHGETRQTDGYSGKYFRLGADIEYPHTTDWDCERVEVNGDIVIDNPENNFEAIGGYLISNNVYSYFCGDFDGDGHTVSGIRIYSEDKSKGLFGQIGAIINNQIQGNANIHDLRLADACITGASSVGGIVGSKYGGIVTRCHVASNVVIQTVSSYPSNYGGIVGFNGQGTIDHCTSAATLTADNSKCSSFGAIAGTNFGTLTDNLAIGATVPACSGGSHGAICGSNENDGTLQRNYYIDCNVAGTANATGVGCHNADAGAVPGFLLSLSKGITSTALTVGDYTVAAAGQAVTLTRGTVPLGYSFAGFTVKKTADNTDVTTGVLSGNVTDGYTLTMPDYDVTVTHSLITDPWEGEGTKDSPYIILNHSQLDLLAERVNNQSDDNDSYSQYSGKYFKLGADIEYPHTTDWNDATSEESNFMAIGNSSNQGHFDGDFDGDGHTVSGIRIIYWSDNKGLFGYLGRSAKIHDLRLANARITGYSIGYSNVGGIVGYNNGTVTRCHVAADVAVCAVQSYAYYHGGIAGQNYGGTIEQCTSAVTLTLTDASGSKYYGGIAGQNISGGTLSDNLAIGATVPATTDNTHGAIVGRNGSNGTLVRNYYVNCKVAGVENATGVGCQNADVTTNDGAVPNMTVTLAPEGYATFYDSRVDLVLPAGTKAYVVSAKGEAEGTLTYEKIADGNDANDNVVPAKTAVLLQTAAATEANSVRPTLRLPKADAYDGTNLLHGSDVETTTTGGDIYYKLTYGEDNSNAANVFGWYWGATGGAAFTSPAHKAWLALPSAGARMFIGLPDDDETTGAKGLTPGPSPKGEGSDSWFTLDGRRLNGKPTTKGLYIINGKKVIIK